MLRGQASLQELIGRSFMNRKSGAKSKKKAEAEAPASSQIKSTAKLETPAPGTPHAASLQPGQVLCPVCGVPALERAMNSHLDSCLAQETLQRGKGDAKQSTLQRFAPVSKPTSTVAAPRQLRRSLTAAAATEPAKQNRKARRSSSDSALLLQGGQQQPHAAAASNALNDDSGEVLPNRLLKPKSGYGHSRHVSSASTPAAALEARANPADLSDTPQLLPQSPTPPSCVHIQTSIVGRRFRTNISCTRHTQLALVRQFDNPRDSNAIQIVDTARQAVLGYLPREIAQHLAGLLDTGSVQVTATADEPKSVAASVPILLEISCTERHNPQEAKIKQTLEMLVQAAADWQAAGLQRQGSNTGACLRTNFLLMADIVVKQDGHLLVEDEKQLLQRFQGLDDEAQCLFLRLFLRKGPWFRLDTLSYSELTHIPTAANRLCQASFATPIYTFPSAAASPTQTPLTSLETHIHSTGDLQPGGSDPLGGGQSEGCSLANVDSCSGQSVCEVAEALTVAELQQLIGQFELGPQGRVTGISKGQMLQLLKAGLEKAGASGAEAAFKQRILMATGPCIKLRQLLCSLINRLQRLFFLNEAQNLSSFLIADLGVAKYPSYTVTRSRSVFTCRQDLLDYEAALQHAAELDNALEDLDTEAADQALQPAFAAIDANLHKQQPSSCGGACSPTQLPFFLRYSSAWVYAAMATTGVSLMEKRKQWQQAVDLLQQLLGGLCCLRRRGEWWTRLSLDLEHLGRPDESLEMAEAALADEWVINGDRVALQRRVLRLGKPPRRWKRPSWAAVALREPLEVCIEGQPLASVLGIKSRFMGNGGEECSVEELALQHYAAQAGGSWTGTHAEGGIWATLFGLLMWDVIFMEVPDIFQTAFHTAPLDLGTVVFYPSRRDAIDGRLTQIREGQGPGLLQQCWQQHLGEWCRGVNWDRHGVEELVTIASCVGGRGLAAVCKLLAEDFSGWAGGMPDLLLWNVNTCKAKLSEVKGPRDRLSEQQRAWINALIDAEVDVEVLKVVEPRQGSAPKRRRKW
ncbi:hypothetical protein ABBQ32_000762 [Trebouxia sp. C0010 RCD-2024]